MRNTPAPDAPLSPWRRRLRWLAIRAVRLAVLAYVCVLGVLYFGQGWLIFPGRTSQGEAYARVDVPAGAELVRLKTASGEDVVAIFSRALDERGAPAEDSASRPTVLYFYGNGDRLANNVAMVTGFRRLGANVMVPEYVGYGESSGAPSEVGCRETAEAAFDALAARPDVDPRRIVSAGSSLGSGVAVDLASRRPVAGLATFSAFTSMVDMGRRDYPYVPVSLLLSYRFESLAKIASVRCPVFVSHGLADGFIPPAMSERLAAAAGGPVTFFPVTGAHHDDLFDVGGAPLGLALAAFLRGCGPA